MAWLWCTLLALAGLASGITHNVTLESTQASPCFSPKQEPNTPLVPISLGPVDDSDRKRVNGDCKIPMRHDGYLWHEIKEGLWFQATGALEVEDDQYTALSNRLECDKGSLSCTLTVSSVASITASETWSYSYSGSVKFSAKLTEALTIEAGTSSGSEHSITASVATSAETSYSCSVPENHTVYLAARIQYYLIFGYVSEHVIVRREFYVDGNGNIRERDIWGWEESCKPFFRIPKVQFDRSVAGTRRCVVEAAPNCPTQEPAVIMV